MSYVNNMSIFVNRLKCLFFSPKNLKLFFGNIYKGGKPNYKNESIKRKIYTLSNQFLKLNK